MQEHISDNLPTSLEKYIDVSLVDLVTKRLRHDIYTGKYKPGQKLVVRKLSEELKVSHTPIKDALNRLVAEGYVVVQPRKSMVVRGCTNRQFIESMQLRLIIEVSCAKDFLEAVEKDPAKIEEMEQYQRLQADLVSIDDVDFEAWITYGGKFHDVYMRTAKNHQMYATYSMLDTNRNSYFAYMKNAGSPFMRRRILQDAVGHVNIITAMKQNNLPALQKALAHHILDVCSDYLADDDAKRAYAQFQTYLNLYSFQVD